MRIPDFALERYFARWEFTTELLLCASDVEPWPMGELLELADEETRRRWDGLRLGYTESAGDPSLRSEIARLYESLDADDVLVFAGGEEAIFTLHNVLLGPGDHAIVVWPAYQSLAEVAGATGAEVSRIGLHESNGWRLDLDEVRAALRPATRLIVVNEPHNPTGALDDADTFDRLVALADEANVRLVVDEAYRFLEFEPDARLPAAADAAPSAVSIGVLSKSFALAGLRIGWLASRDRSLLDRAARFKDYTTICNSGPSELLAVIALRARERVLERSRGLIERNLAELDRFFERQADAFEWVRPRAGSVGYPRLKAAIPIGEFAEEVLREAGVLLLPGPIFEDDSNHFRIGFGRADLPVALERFETYAERRFGHG